MKNQYTEDVLIEQPAIAPVLTQIQNNCQEGLGAGGDLGREHRSEVILSTRLRAALRKLNPQLPQNALDLALAKLTCPRATLPLVAAIVKALNNDLKQLPSHLRLKMEELLQRALRRDPALKGKNYESLAGLLEFADLRELESTIVSKDA